MAKIEKYNLNKKPCRTCMVIRLFIVAMLMLLIIAILAKDQMHHLSIITSGKVAAIIWIFGGVSFFVKFIHWKFFSQNNPETSDLSQNE